MSDDELVAGLLARRPAALAALIDAYGAPVFTLCSRILAGVGTAQDIEECTSDAFHGAWQQIARFDPARAPLRTWILMLAKYQALERRRRLQPPLATVAQPEAGLPGPETELLAAEERQQVGAALAALSPLDRQLVYRRYYLDERVDTIARDLGLTRPAADNRLWRARATLRRLLGVSEEVADHGSR